MNEELLRQRFDTLPGMLPQGAEPRQLREAAEQYYELAEQAEAAGCPEIAMRCRAMDRELSEALAAAQPTPENWRALCYTCQAEGLLALRMDRRFAARMAFARCIELDEARVQAADPADPDARCDQITNLQYAGDMEFTYNYREEARGFYTRALALAAALAADRPTPENRRAHAAGLCRMGRLDALESRYGDAKVHFEAAEAILLALTEEPCTDAADSTALQGELAAVQKLQQELAQESAEMRRLAALVEEKLKQKK